jgi:glycosyltransferase involved in cell wall biosynthesis
LALTARADWPETTCTELRSGTGHGTEKRAARPSRQPGTELHALTDHFSAVSTLLRRNKTSAKDLPAGFDPATYLALNPDVASARVDPAAHYRRHGRGELRALLPEGQGLRHTQSRALSDTERASWRDTLRAAAAGTSLAKIIAKHPRAAWLWTGFTLAGYLQQAPDVASAVEDPLEAAFHFLEFGLEEGRMGRPGSWDPHFVAARYGLATDTATDTHVTVLARVLAQGVSPLDAVLDERQLWERSGLCGAELERLFDHEYYHALYNGDAARNLPATDDRPALIAHFVEHGIDAIRPVEPDGDFDADFYTQQLDAETRDALLPADPETGARPDPAAPATARRLYRHWLKSGLRAGFSPNLKSWGRRSAGLRIPEALFTQMPIFGLAAGLDPDTPPLRMLEHFLAEPRPAASALDVSDRDAADLVVTLADRAVMDGATDKAEWLYWLVLSAHPGHQRARHHFADLVQRSNCLEMVCNLREGRDADQGDGWNILWMVLSARPDHQRARHHCADLVQRSNRLEMVCNLREGLDADQGGGWNILFLAEALIQRQRIEDALQALAKLPGKFREDTAIAAKRRMLAQQIFDHIWHNVAAHAAAYGIARTQAQLRQALQLYTPDFSLVERSRPVRRVALVGSGDLYQCKLYRVDQKSEQLRAAGLDVTVISPTHDLLDFTARVDDFDAVIFFRVPAFPATIDAIATAAQHGLLTFYEIDDIVFDSAHFPPSFESYAGQINANDYAAMACGVPLFEHAMGLCDYGIASTATVARLMADHVRSGEVIEHHNALGRLHMAAIDAAAPARSKIQPVTLLYASGTKAHKEDFHETLEPALAEILRRHGKRVRICLVGHFGTFRHLDTESAQVEIRAPVWDFEAYCDLVARADINLSVLSRSLLTDAKSEIKWMEAAMFGRPSVVSDTATHREVIVDGETGFLAARSQDFIDRLDTLVRDPELRERIGRAAREVVLRDYAIESMGRGLRDAFDRLRPPDSTPKRRLMVVNVFYPPQAIGGATRVVHDNVTLLREHYGDRYEIDVVCTLEGGSEPLSVTTYSQDGVRVWAITAPPQPDGDLTASDPEMAARFEQLVDRLGPDLIHFHCVQRLTAAAVNVARLRRIPYLITLHDGWWISPNQFIIDARERPEYYDFDARHDPDFPPRAQVLARPLLAATRLLAVSDSFAELHRAHGLPNVEVIENGVSDLPSCQRRPSPSGRVRLAQIGGASRHKGIHLVRNALLAEPYENLELLLIDHAMTPGRETSEVWGTTPVTRTAKVPQAEIADLYAGIDVLLAPSIWPESYGLVTREAMACGVWVIASDRGAIGADIIEGVTGHRIDVSSYEGLAETLRQVDSDPDRYLAPPGDMPPARHVREQVDELAELYDTLVPAADGP